MASATTLILPHRSLVMIGETDIDGGCRGHYSKALDGVLGSLVAKQLTCATLPQVFLTKSGVAAECALVVEVTVFCEAVADLLSLMIRTVSGVRFLSRALDQKMMAVPTPSGQGATLEPGSAAWKR